MELQVLELTKGKSRLQFWADDQPLVHVDITISATRDGRSLYEITIDPSSTGMTRDRAVVHASIWRKT